MQLLVSLVVGYIARALHPGKDSIGFIMTVILATGRSFLARYAGTALGWYQQGQTASWIASVVGVIILLVIYGMVKGKVSE